MGRVTSDGEVRNLLKKTQVRGVYWRRRAFVWGDKSRENDGY